MSKTIKFNNKTVLLNVVVVYQLFRRYMKWIINKSVPVLTLLCYILLFLYCCSQIFPNPCPLSLLKDKFLTATVAQTEESLPWPPPPCRLFFWLEFQKESLQWTERLRVLFLEESLSAYRTGNHRTYLWLFVLKIHSDHLITGYSGFI